MSHTHAHSGVMPDPTLVNLGHGFHAYVQLDGSWGLYNAGIFVGERAVTLIDTTFTEPRGQALRSAVTDMTKNPITTIVNTHHHGDHTYGNSVFPESTVIGHQICRDAVIATGMETAKWFHGVEWGDIVITPPTVTFEETLSVYCDDTKAELAFQGPAHSTNDVTMWVKDYGLLFTGDLVFNGGTPFVLMGSVRGSIEAIARMKALDPTVIVPGHGPVCDAGVLDDMLRYFLFIQHEAKQGFDAGKEPHEIAEGIDLGDFAHLTDMERLVGNLHRAYSELRGDAAGIALDWDQIVDEMVAYNHGQPLRCLA